MNNTKTCFLTALLASLLLMPMAAFAGAYTYNSGLSLRTVNAGILVLSGTELSSALDNPDPYVFYVLSKRADVAPYGWTIVNPLAPKNVTSSIKLRWDARDAANPYTIAQSIGPEMGAYWEVPLGATPGDDLQQFDILLLDLKGGTVQFTVSDAEKLRRFVDGGGTLWIEGGIYNGGLGSIGSSNALFLSTITFQTSGSVPASSPKVTAAAQALATTPYALGQTELDTLVNGNVNVTASGDALTVLAPVLNIAGGGGTIAAAGSYGAGAVVVTSTYTATVINTNSINGSTGREIYSSYLGSVQPPGALAFPMTSALKFLSNLIAWGGGHSSEHRSSHQEGADFNAFPSPVRLWNGAVTGGASVVPPAPTIYGSLAFVTDAAGVLHAFNIKPGATSDLGTVDYSRFPGPTSYDEVWRVTVGANSSAPAVINNNGTVVVMVEKTDGTVAQFKLQDGSAGSPLGTSGGTYSTGSAPAPVAYGGTLYALQASGSLFAYSLTASAALGTYTPSLGTTTPVATGAPAVGIVPVEGTFTGFTPPTNDILALLPTSQYLYSVFLGSRGEQLRQSAAPSNFVTKLLGGSKIKSMQSPLGAYGIDQTTGFIVSPGRSTVLDTNRTTFTGLVSAPTYFADYNADVSASGTDLTRTQVGISSKATIDSGTSGTISAPALDRFGNSYYVTTNSLPGGAGGTISTLVSFHDSATPGNIRLNWRFRLPTSLDGTVIDADNIDYTSGGRSLTGYLFQGAPVVDERGIVYALATNGANVAILCFNGLQPVTIASPLNGFDTITQQIPALPAAGSTTVGADEFGNGTADPISPAQLAPDGVTLRSFGKFGVSNGLTRTLYPDLSEPQALAVAITNNVPNPTYVPATLHTNLAWYTILPGTVAGGATLSGLTKAGGSLFLVDGAGHLISVIADPVSTGIPVINKYVDSNPTGGALPAMVTDYGDTGVGSYGAVPAIADGALVVNGQGGIAGYANRVTVVTDGSRVLELNSGGDATWLVDSTTGAAPGSTLAAALNNVNAAVSLGTSLELNHPSAVTEIAANDYLVADTGNNRCVRFSRSGQVIWELSRVNDEYNINSGDDVSASLGKASGTTLLAPGEPATLNQPTGVQIYTETRTVGSGVYTIVHYLISDSGNYRILEVVDVFDSNGAIVGSPHNLIWVSHTHDKQQRNYRYQSAAFYPSASNPLFVVSLVTNAAIATTSAGSGALSASNQDAAGGSIVLLDHSTAKSGYPTGIFTSFQALLSGGKFNLAAAVAGGAPNARLSLRNPRYLKAYVPQNAANGGPSQAFLLADDNGVFDLTPNAAGTALTAQWGFTQADYQAMTTPVSTDALAVNSQQPQQRQFNRGRIPFIPGSIQRTSSDQVGVYSIGHYIVTNSYSGGEASSVGGFGGEVFELGATDSTGTLQTIEVHDNPSGSLGSSPLRYLGTTFSRPSNTGALVQPTFAYRVP